MSLPRLPLLPALLLLSACASRATALRVEAFPSAPASAEAPEAHGTAHPLTFEGAAPDGRWVLACQAREDTNGDGRIETTRDKEGALTGDAMRQYLFLEPGPGVPIDAVLASSPPSLRYLVLRRAGSIRLLDTWERQETVLVADASRVQNQNPSFSEDGRRLLYLRPEGGDVALVLRDMEARTERVLDMGPGVLVDAKLDPSGHWVVLDKVEQDTDGDGKLHRAPWRSGMQYEPCRGLFQAGEEEEVPGDLSVRSYLRVDGGTLHHGSDIIGPLGAGLLRRAKDGTLVVEDARGQREMWVPASCEGERVFEDRQRKQLLMACRVDAHSWQLQLHGPGVHVALGGRMVPNREDLPRPSVVPQRLHVFQVIDASRFEEKSVLVDLERRTLEPLDYSLVAERGTWALLREKPPGQGAEDFRGKLLLWQLDTGDRTVVGEAGPSSELWSRDHHLYMGWLVNLREGRVLGRMDPKPFAIDSEARVLRAREMPEDLELGIARGPLRWEPAVKAEASEGP